MRRTRFLRYFKACRGLQEGIQGMSYIEKINQEIKRMASEGYAPEQAMYEMALNAGLGTFNPYRASDEELEIIARNI